MANMSYCRFRNTNSDLSDCLDALAWGEKLSDDEIKSGKSMFKEFLDFCLYNHIIDGYCENSIVDMFESARKKEEA